MPTDNNDFADIIPNSNKVVIGGNVAITNSANRESYHNAQLIGALKKVTLPSKGYVAIEYESNQYFKYDPTPIPVFSLTSCTCNCGGTHTKDQTIVVNEDLLETGSYEICIEPFIDVPECTGYSTTNNDARMNIYNSAGSLLFSEGFDYPTATCMTGNLKDLVSRMGVGLQAGQSYRFEVESLNASARLSLSYLTGGGNQTVGGLRVSKTTAYTGNTNSNGSENHDKDIINTYEYNDVNTPTRSSGILFNQPEYAFKLNDYSVLFTSSSLLPLSGFAGYHIGYKNTVINQNGNGSIQYEFFIEDTINIYNRYPIATEPIRVEAGVMKTQETLHQNSTVEVSNTITPYSQDPYTDVTGFTFKSQDIPTYDGSNIVNDFNHYNVYTPRTGVFRNGIVTSTQDGVSSTTNYEYHPTIIAPTEISSTNSDGKETVQKIHYTIDHPSLLMQNNFDFTNRIAIPYEDTVMVDGNVLGGSRTSFAYFDGDGDNPNEIFLIGGYIRPYKTWRYERTWKDGILQVGSWDIQEYFESYTDDGMLESWRKNHWGDSETYNYQNRLLTSKTYLTFKDSTEYYSNNSSLVKRVISVDGTSSSITYDSLLRPKIITDDQKNITTTFDYHFTTGAGDKNYVKTTTNYPTPVTESTLDILENYDYKDGLGRTIATLRKGQGPDSANDDIISVVAYDNQGRAFKAYEPQLLTSNNGAYQAPLGTWEFTETTFYPSPLNRKHTVTPPDWATITYQYGSNTAVDGITIDSTNTAYGDKELFKQIAIDGNTNKSIVFTDKKGRTIVSRRTDNVEATGLNYDTKYIYDDKDRRVYSLPPSTDISQKDLLFFCEYDKEDRKSREYHPGKAEMEYVYNLQDLLIGRRDGYLKERGLWYSYQYDPYGRELKSGFYNQATLNTSTPLGIAPSELLLETIYGTTAHEKDKVKTIKTKILDGGNNWLETTNTYSTSALLTSQTSNNHRNLTTNIETTTIIYDGADNPITATYNHKAFGNDFDVITTETIDYAGRARESRFQANSSPTYTINSKFYDEEEQLIRKLQGKTGFGGGQAWLQQCDYSYFENGLLHQINGDNLTGTQRALSDCPNALPNPGLPNLTNLDNKDLFYLELAYQTPFAGTSAMAQNNGNITGVKWQVRGREKQGFSLQYDIYNRLTNADYFDEDSGSPLTETGIYDVDMTYDQRGNIQTLSRYGLNQTKDCYEPVLIDQLNYSYRDSNQLKMVTDNAPCPDSLFIGKSLDNQHLYAVSRTIEADNVVNAYADITYQGDTSVTLLAGFHAKAGTNFTARIDGCPIMGFETGGYTQRNEDSSRYDVNGNLMFDPQKGLHTYFNHLDLADSIIFETGNSIHFTYDATGALLIKELRDSSGQVLETRDYIGGAEYINDTLESIYHGEGRLHYINGNSQMEYSTADHLGNTRLVYADLNNNGVIETPSEILDEAHYYPNGLKLEGYWMNSNRFRYTFNGIEEIDDFGLNVNRATFRTLDPELGRWWSVDPKATVLMGLSPYNSMNNSPIVFNDPNGDIAPLIVAGAAIIGGSINVATHWNQIGSLNEGLAAFGIGAAGGAVAALTGGVAAAGLGLGTTGAAAGLVGGAIGEAFGGPITGIGNGLVFGDNYTGGDWAKGILWGGIFGAGLGALDAGLKGLDPITGKIKPTGTAGVTGSTSGVGNVSQGPYTGPEHMWSPDNLGDIYRKGDRAGSQAIVRASGSGGGGIPWSSLRVEQAAKALSRGANEITVGNQSQAEELFLRLYQANGYTNTTGFNGKQVREFFPNGKYGTYHWDLFDTLHGGRPHLQIHPFKAEASKRIIRIFFGDN